MSNDRTILTENFVQQAIIEYLAQNKWNRTLKFANLYEKGVDIKVQHKEYGRYWLIEVKGDPSGKVKSPTGSRSSSFNSAVGQILTRMYNNRKPKYISCEHGYKYGIAFSTFFRDMVIKKMPYWVMQRLCLYMFFVDKNSKVEELNWQKMKKFQIKLREKIDKKVVSGRNFLETNKKNRLKSKNYE